MRPVPMFVGTLAALVLAARPSSAQSQPGGAAARDSLFRCARAITAAEGFALAPQRSAERMSFMRTNESPGASNLLDALSVSLAPADSTGAVRLHVRLTTFLVSRSTGLSEGEVTPRPSLAALADTLHARCRFAPGTAPHP